MIIRSATLGIDLHSQNKVQLESNVSNFFDQATKLFAKHSFEFRTRRIVLPALAMKDSIDNEKINSAVSWISNFCAGKGIRWFCVPFLTFGQQMREVNSVAIEIAKRHKNAFINFIVAEEGRLNRHGALYASKFIKSISMLSGNGYDNFRVGASFNCRPNGPFFPFTYHSGNNGFSIALELVPLFIDSIEQNKGKRIEVIREKILERISPELKRVDATGFAIEQETGMVYYGTDASLAPFPDSDDGSVARIIELLGTDGFGSYGTIFLTSFLTDIIRELVIRSGIKTIGFNGVMFSLLEDTRLGINHSSKEFSIDSLLSYSTVCGCGADMIPVPGDIFEEEIASIMIDVASISTVLKKPLGVRILPIPGKHAYEFTEFSYDFLHNTRIHQAKHRACFNELLDIKEPFSYLTR